jgi:hypothetical protein
VEFREEITEADIPLSHWISWMMPQQLPFSLTQVMRVTVANTP